MSNFRLALNNAILVTGDSSIVTPYIRKKVYTIICIDFIVGFFNTGWFSMTTISTSKKFGLVRNLRINSLDKSKMLTDLVLIMETFLSCLEL